MLSSTEHSPGPATAGMVHSALLEVFVRKRATGPPSPHMRASMVCDALNPRPTIVTRLPPTTGALLGMIMCNSTDRSYAYCTPVWLYARPSLLISSDTVPGIPTGIRQTVLVEDTGRACTTPKRPTLHTTSAERPK